jgi:hypothetical protein
MDIGINLCIDVHGQPGPVSKFVQELVERCYQNRAHDQIVITRCMLVDKQEHLRRVPVPAADAIATKTITYDTASYDMIETIALFIPA